MKRFLAILLALLMLFSSCAAPAEPQREEAPQVGGEQTAENTENTDTDDTDAEDKAIYDRFGFEVEADFHPMEEIEAVLDPDYQRQEYGATGLQGAGERISCISFNVLSYDTHSAGYAEPAERAELVVDFLREQKADLVGLQEVTNAHGYDWVKTIREGLSDLYDFRMVIEEEGEVPYTTMSIATGLMFLYRKDRFELKESGGFEYWDDSRACHWIRLYDSRAGRDVYFTNTHFSIDGGSFLNGNRLRCGEALELLSFWKNTVGDNALFATGDYNSKSYDDPHLLILQKSCYQPSCDVALESDGASTLDFCYVNTKATDVERYEFLDKGYRGEDGIALDMSDHNPVLTVAVYK